MLSQLRGPGEIEAAVLMMRQVHQGSFLIVEGEDDAKFWKAWTRDPDCEVVIGGGKAAVTGAIARLDGRAFVGAVGIIDDDCDSLLGRTVASPNLCVTHARDLEGVLLQTAALSRLVAEYGSASQVKGIDVAARLLENALPFGRLRWLAYRAQQGIDFKPLSPVRFVVAKTWMVDVPALHAAVVVQGHFSDAASLELALDGLGSADPWLVVQGHDLVQVLSIGFAHVLGTKEPGRDAIARALRLAVDQAEIKRTPLWNHLLAWQARNPPFVVLA